MTQPTPIIEITKLVVNEAESLKTAENFQQAIKNIWEALAELEGGVIPYASVAQLVFTKSNDNDLADVIGRMRETVEDIRTGNLLQEELLEKYEIDKVIEHLDLANTQQQFLYRSQNSDIKNINDKYDKISGDIDTKFEEAEKRSDEFFNDLDTNIDNRMNSIYSGFVSVLGIFVAISFSLFGAATLLKNIFQISTQSGFNTNHEVIGTNIILAGVATILIYLLLIGLMEAVANITGHYYDFSFRRIFIVLFVAGFIILTGLIYKNPDLSAINHPVFYGAILIVYLGIGWGTLKFGGRIKYWILPNSLKLQSTEELDD